MTKRIGVVLVTALCLLFAPIASAQFQIAGSTFGTGGNTVSGGNFMIMGTLGQGGVGLSSGDHQLCTGHWCRGGLIAVSVEGPRQTPEQLEFHLAGPNPTRSIATFHLSLPKAMNVQVMIYNVRGQRVAEPASGQMEAGVHRIEWNGQGKSGVYFARLLVNGEVRSEERVVLIR